MRNNQNCSSNITDTPETLPNGNDNVHPYSYATERSSKGKEYIQPYSYIKQPYLDISDISVVSVRQHIGKVENSFYFWDTSTSSQVSNNDGVVLEIYLDHKFQWSQEGLNCESLAYDAVT